MASLMNSGRSRVPLPGPACQRGFTLVAVLIATVLMGAGLAAIGELWSKTRQREMEKDLLFTGNQFRSAIASYYERSPGGAKRYPETLQDLLLDKRYATVQRHLRRIFPDPATSRAEWGLVKAPEGGIMGVYSLSREQPLKTANFAFFNAGFAKAQTYADWQFSYAPRAVVVPPGPSSGASLPSQSPPPR